MRRRRSIGIFVILTAFVVFACDKELNFPIGFEFDMGDCGGCWLSEENGLISFVVKSDSDYDSLLESCFPEDYREEWLPPRPGPEDELVFVSLKGGGCVGCLDITNIYEDSQSIAVEVEGGFQGACDMLIAPGEWTLIPKSDKPVIFQFQEVRCPDDQTQLL